MFVVTPSDNDCLNYNLIVKELFDLANKCSAEEFSTVDKDGRSFKVTFTYAILKCLKRFAIAPLVPECGAETNPCPNCDVRTIQCFSK